MLELGEVARNHRNIEASEDRLLGLPVEQEAKSGLEATLGRMLAGCQLLAFHFRYCDAVTGFTLSFTDHDLEIEWVALTDALHLDHAVTPVSTVVGASVRSLPHRIRRPAKMFVSFSAQSLSLLGFRPRAAPQGMFVTASKIRTRFPKFVRRHKIRETSQNMTPEYGLIPCNREPL
jgi:hypothetical protein